MIKKTYIGLDITTSQMRAVALRRAGHQAQLIGARVLPLGEGQFAFSAQEPNILDAKRFVDNLHELVEPLAGREERLALSLPDRVGRVLLAEVDTAFKSHAEGADILKWKLKNSLPGDPRDVQLDYQILEKDERGQTRVIVSLIHLSVLSQYEDLLVEAGFNATIIDFHSLNLYNFYRPRINFGDDFVLVSVDGDTLSLQFYHDRKPFLLRVLELKADPVQVFHEIDRSIVRHRNHPGFVRAGVFLHYEQEEAEEMLRALRTVFDRDVMLLKPPVARMSSSPMRLAGDENGLAASIGAAERLF